MKVLLVNPKINGEILEGFPLSLGYLSSSLKYQRNGIDEIRAIDYNTPESSMIEKEIEYWKPDLIGVSMMIPSFNEGKKEILRLKKYSPHAFVLVGGIAAATIKEHILDIPHVDAVYRGEGESEFANLVSSIENDNWKGSNNISYKEDGKIVDRPLAPFISNLDEIPFPDRELVEIKHYLQDIHGSDRKAASIISSRGCPYNCVFCYRGPAAGKKFRKRSSNNFVEEIHHLMDKYGVNAFMIWDDNFLLDRNRVIEICNYIKNDKLEWKCQARVDSLDRELLENMKEAGCVSLNIGIESGNEEILKKMKKGITKKQSEEAIKLCKEIGIFTNAYFILGMPWDTYETINETIDFAIEISPDKAHFFEATPFPGTELREIAIKKGLPVNEDWDNYLLKKTNSPVIETKNFSKEQLHEWVREANIKFKEAKNVS